MAVFSLSDPLKLFSAPLIFYISFQIQPWDKGSLIQCNLVPNTVNTSLVNQSACVCLNHDDVNKALINFMAHDYILLCFC